MLDVLFSNANALALANILKHSLNVKGKLFAELMNLNSLRKVTSIHGFSYDLSSCSYYL